MNNYEKTNNSERTSSSDPGLTALLLPLPLAARLLAVSPDTFRRLSSSGAAPKPVRLGRAVRWRLDQLEQWIADGCPRVAPSRRPGRGVR